MAGFQDVGVFKYNGYEFTNALHITVKTEPVRDEANRTVIYWMHTISIETVIADSVEGTGVSIEVARELLSQDGGALIFTGKGYGDIEVNNGGVRDVAWGPKTQVLSWTPIGSSSACLVNWSVSTCLSPCDIYDGVMAFNYGVTYSINESGDTTRVINGYLQIAQTRTGGADAENSRVVPDTADRYLDLIVVAPMNGFKRNTTRNLSKDRSRLDFTITDSQIPTNNPYPPDCIDITASHGVRWSRKGEIARQGGNFNVNVTLKPGVSGVQAWVIFLQIVLPRMLATVARTKKGVFIDEISVSEDIFSRSHSFRLSYKFMSCIDRFLYDSAIWERTNTNWNIWKVSLQNSMFSNRGSAGLQHTTEQDAIIDLCGGFATDTADEVDNRYDAPTSANPILGVEPDAENSWLDYDNELIVMRDRPVSRQSLQQDEESDVNEGADEEDPDQGAESKDAEWPKKGGEDDVITVSGRGRYAVRMQGHGTRVGHKIPRPALLKVGDADAVEKRITMNQRVKYNALGVPVYQSAWVVDYEVANSPGVVPPLSNKKECVNGTTGKAKKPK